MISISGDILSLNRSLSLPGTKKSALSLAATTCYLPTSRSEVNATKSLTVSTGGQDNLLGPPSEPVRRKRIKKSTRQEKNNDKVK